MLWLRDFLGPVASADGGFWFAIASGLHGWKKSAYLQSGSKALSMKQVSFFPVKRFVIGALVVLLCCVNATAEAAPIRFPVETEGSPETGSEKAPVTIVEFTDFECPFCGTVQPTI